MAIKIETEIIENYRKENNLTVEQFCKKFNISKIVCKTKNSFPLIAGETVF